MNEKLDFLKALFTYLKKLLIFIKINSFGRLQTRTRTLLYSSLSPYLPQNTDELFQTRPEILTFDYKNTTSRQSLSDLSDQLIANIMLHPNLFTKDLQDFAVFKEIILPTFSNIFYSFDKNYQQILERKNYYHTLLESGLLQSESITSNINDNQQNIQLPSSRQPKPSSFNLNLKKIPTINDAKSLISFLTCSVPLPLKFSKTYVSSLSPIEEQIYQIYDSYSNSIEFLYYCYIWALATGNIEVLLKVLFSSFFLSISEEHSSKIKSIKYDSNFKNSFRSDSLFAVFPKQITGFISYDDFSAKFHHHKSIFAVSKEFIFTINLNSVLSSISFSDTILNRSDRFTTIKLKPMQERVPPVLAISDNYLYVGLDEPCIFTISPFVLCSGSITYSKNSPRIKPPCTSDGHFIYSLISKTEIAVFVIQFPKISHIKTIKVKMGNSQLLIPFKDKLVYKRWLNSACVFTDGLTFRIITFEGEPGKVQHFIRSFSLIDGTHISDQKILYQFVIHSIAYEPFSNSYYILCPHSDGSEILRFDNTGSKPSWTAGIDLNGLISYSNLQKLFESPSIKPYTLSMQILSILQYAVIPLMGSEIESPRINQLTASYLSNPLKSENIITLILDIIVLLNTDNISITSELNRENIVLSVKTLLVLLDLNLSHSNNQNLQNASSIKIIAILSSIIMKDEQYRTTVFFIFVNHFNSLFNNARDMISDSFAFFLKDITLTEMKFLNQLSTSELFPYLYSEQMFPMFYASKIQKIRKNNIIETNELDFLLNVQYSLFTHVEKDHSLLKSSLALSKTMIEQMSFFLDDLNEYNDDEFKNSVFIQLYRKFLLLIHYSSHYYDFSVSLLDFLFRLIKSFILASQRLGITNTDSSLYLVFTESFEMCISSFCVILKGKDDLIKANKFTSIIKSYKEPNCPNVDLDLVFQQKYSMPDNDFIEFYYQNIKHPMNKNITNEAKMFESKLLIILSDIMKIDIFQKEINPNTRMVVQAVYKIRTSLRSSKQLTAQLDDKQPTKIVEQYPLYLSQVKEKVAFLTYLTNSLDQPVNLTEIINFVSNEMNLESFLKLFSEIESLSKNIRKVFDLLSNLLKIDNFPVYVLSPLFQRICNDPSILDNLSSITIFCDVEDFQQPCFELIQSIASIKGTIPLTSFLSFSALLILLASNQKKLTSNENYAVVYSLFACACNNAVDDINSRRFTQCFTFLCYFLRLLFDMNYIEPINHKMEEIQALFQSIPNQHSFNFMISHSMLHAGFKNKVSLDSLMTLFHSVSVLDMHSYCLLLYECLIIEQSSITQILLTFLDEIGSILIGNKSSILADALTINQIPKLFNSVQKRKYELKTAKAQFNICIQLIILFRRLLLTTSKAADSIRSLFSEIIHNYLDSPNDFTILKRLIAVCGIISNAISLFSPLSFIRSHVNNQTFFISKIKNNELFGFLLPITGPFNSSYLSVNPNEVESFSLLQFSTSMYYDKDAENSLYNHILYNDVGSTESSLVSFYVLNCLRERILDPNLNDTFTHNFLVNLKPMKVEGFQFTFNTSHIIKLISKRLMNSSERNENIAFHHCSFAKLPLFDDYQIKDTELLSNKGTNIFMTNLIPPNESISFAVSLGERRIPNLYIGFVTHALEKNHFFAIVYNTTDGWIYTNSEKLFSLEKTEQLIEIRYISTSKTVEFATSLKSQPLFSLKLHHCYFSYVAVLPPNSTVQYYLGKNCQLQCNRTEADKSQSFRTASSLLLNQSSIEEQGVKSTFQLNYQNNLINDITFLPVNPVYDFSMRWHIKEDNLQYFTISDQLLSAARSDQVLQPMIDSDNKISDYITFKSIELNSSFLPLKTNLNILYYLSKDPNIWSISTNVNNTSIKVEDYNGTFRIINDLVGLKPMKVISLYEEMNQLPIGIIDSYLCGFCHLHRCELITQLIIHSISDKSLRFDQIFSLDFDFLYNFIIQILVLIEPFHATNINEGRSPIDLEFNSISSSCANSNYFEHHLALCELFDNFVSIHKKEFYQYWYQRLIMSFNDEYMHFVNDNNTDVIVVHSNAKTTASLKISKPNSTGFLAFPIQFGHRSLPRLKFTSNSSTDIDNSSDEINNSTETGEMSGSSPTREKLPNNDEKGFDYSPIRKSSKKTSPVSTRNSDISYNSHLRSSLNERPHHNRQHNLTSDSPERALPKHRHIDNDKSESNNEEQQKKEQVTYTYIESDSFTIIECETNYAFLPVFVDNSSYKHSFIELAISFKYFVLCMNGHLDQLDFLDQKEIIQAKIELRKHIYFAIVSGSPFFYTHDYALLKFLAANLPLAVSDFTPEYVHILNSFSLTSQTIPHQPVQDFIQEQTLLFDDHKAEAYRKFFPEFCDPHDLDINKTPDMSEFQMPPITLPAVLTESDPSTRPTLLSIKRILKPRTNLNNFPFHLVINEWAYYFALYPPVDIRIETQCTLSIKFPVYTPNAIRLLDRDVELVDSEIEYSYSTFFSQPCKSSILQPIPLQSNFLCVRFKITENISEHSFIVVSAIMNDGKSSTKNDYYRTDKPSTSLILSPDQINLDTVVMKNRERFVNDMREMFFQWAKRDDQMILVHVKTEMFNLSTIRIVIDPLELASIQSSSTMHGKRSTHLVALRSQLLIGFNWLCAHYQQILNSSDSFYEYRQFLSMLLSIKQFQELVEEKSSSGSKTYANLRINRRAGLEVRNGISKRLDQSMIAQFAVQYKHSSSFRSIKRPFHIEYVGEKGIDVGGLARDFASELAKDICEYRVGLFVPTPNARNKVGSYHECLVPSPDPRIQDPQRLYKVVGAFLAIAVRAKIVQPFNFPPFFWDYLAGEQITIEHVYEVDEVYRKSMSKLQSALDSNISVDEFNKDYNTVKTCVVNFRGEEIPILEDHHNRNNSSTHDLKGMNSPQNHSRYLTIQNCKKFITKSHEYRIKELEIPMSYISHGFWENLNFRVPPYVTPELLEFLVCGEREVDLRQLRAVTQFTAVSKEQQAMFWSALGRMSNEQRRNFLQFATGSMCIPQNASALFLTVEKVEGPPDKRLPAASTCFNKIHMPIYSSAEKMLRAMITAFEYTGTFENS